MFKTLYKMFFYQYPVAQAHELKQTLKYDKKIKKTYNINKLILYKGFDEIQKKNNFYNMINLDSLLYIVNKKSNIINFTIDKDDLIQKDYNNEYYTTNLLNIIEIKIHDVDDIDCTKIEDYNYFRNRMRDKFGYRPKNSEMEDELYKQYYYHYHFENNIKLKCLIKSGGNFTINRISMFRSRLVE